ncbi:hypothetical protein HG535_0D05610 [Zygotorulaspora mrakii]|uniref:Mitochondrial fusion and transport protein UGO1 n=1 Tax=Zygotorulaspora mrakii TaxID=42260 RepID=A0A7H9B515_ZYGMR|nr:uncharacterized protein HG535_0D05610 [Zygotorulaspora mrakii]QLG72852.1 hypothetical protein HG535_0D05610 [Zygotorulaspora mrakii]
MEDSGNRLQARPYYNPEDFNAGYSAIFRPDKGVVDVNGQTMASKLAVVQSSGSRIGKNAFSKKASGSLLSGLSFGDSKKLFTRDTNGTNIESHKNISDMEWSDFLNVRTWKKILGQLCDQFLRKYFKHLIQQPFEVARVLLQVGDFNEIVERDNCSARLPVELKNELADDPAYPEKDDFNEEIDFFPTTNDSSRWRSAVLNEEESKREHEDFVNANEIIITPESNHTMDIMNALMDNEGIRGLWKANNTTFIYNFLSITLDAWFTGIISPFLGIPDPYFMDLIHSPNLKASIILTLSANILTKIVLLPLDIIRTRFIVTSIHRGAKPIRSLKKLIRNWSWSKDGVKISIDMWILTILQSVFNVTFNKLFDVLIYHEFNVEKHSQIKWYSSLKFVSQFMELFAKLPIENLLRRCQVNYLINSNQNSLSIDRNDLVIKPIRYEGVWNSIKSKKMTMELWNGWRVSLMSLVCYYGFEMMNNDPIDLEQEKF